MTDKLIRIENEVKELKEMIRILINKVDKINNNIDTNVVTECKKMGNHISFIENVYENVQRPMWYLCNKVNYLIGKNVINSKTEPKLIMNY